MADLKPYPFPALLRRMFGELERDDSVFDLPRSKFFLGDPGLDFSVPFHAHRPSSPLGPAAGPQSQMAQNLVLSWLGGSRILELKTVQVIDDLEIGRPCIDAQTVGYNIEWSQELSVPESLDEYVKGMMLIEILRASGKIEVAPGFERVLYDMSVGYDLEGIRSEKVQRFVRGMLDASDVIDRFRREMPPELAAYRDLDFPARLADTLTLSTFHGCPPDEIERIIDFLLKENGLHCIVKLNPTLLGPDEARRLLHEVLGYTELVIPDSAFEKDTRWEQAVEFLGRLGETAESLELGFGVKLSNTLIVENHRDFFPATEREMYLSGQPLHVLTMNLVGRVRETFGTRYPVSFAAGIDRTNFADAVALGLVPVTVCTDLLRPGGYARQKTYLDALAKRMRDAGARSIDELVLRGFGHEEEALRICGTGAGSPEHVAAASVLNTRTYVERVTADPRYRKERNSKVPKKIGSRLTLFDCITCDKCVPVCPNDANFTYDVPATEIPVVKMRRIEGGWRAERGNAITVEQRHQIANFADFCNDCGNCDVFCPEDGGPYVMKPRFYGSEEAFREGAPADGFFLGSGIGDDCVVLGRFAGRDYRVSVQDDRAEYAGDGFAVTFSPADPEGSIEGTADGEVDLTYYRIMVLLRRMLLADRGTTWVNSLA